MTFIRKHKFIFIIGGVGIVVLLGLIILLFANVNQDENYKYGKRLDGIENVIIDDSKIEDIKVKILEDKNMSGIKYKLDGRLVKFFIEVKKDTDELSAENILNIIIDNFTTEEKSYYDFQVFVTCEVKQELYPMIAYKHRNNEIFSITKKEGSNDEE